MTDFDPTQTEIYRPAPHEMVWHLLPECFGMSEVPETTSGTHLRVARHDDEIVGVYLARAVDVLRYRICWIGVEPEFRNAGLGSWLLGHAIGISESKGAREIIAPTGYHGSLLTRIGFQPYGDELLLTLTAD